MKNNHKNNKRTFLKDSAILEAMLAFAPQLLNAESWATGLRSPAGLSMIDGEVFLY